MAEPTFETSVFINCPFDADYIPIRNALVFCLLDLGFEPRIATERLNSAELRLEKIRELIEASRFSIHDLSRAQAKRKGEMFRLNMPFELGIDYACRLYCGNGRETKKILILEEHPHRHHASISDLAGCDVRSHGSEYDAAIRQVRYWIASEAGLRDCIGPARIVARYDDFRAWHFAKLQERGFSQEDIDEYTMHELLGSMREWIASGRPPPSPADPRAAP